ncbi:hypothetical protein M948_18115 [Virgibacillus sp. CM-4]|uniref:hypothetical protein n=1 Tax=Virgibacillus sp. CM-4 TaxID=1354277 RepID=UPI0003884092|nr:hypothetical protein [Virgibacillus sp. CM-4]EQB35021.1 hypothetical protein M948_18115 [Virgibacillus sp. CM-4]
MPVRVPKRVAEAFDYHHKLWKWMSKESRVLMFMSIPSSCVEGKALILKEFANKYPITFLDAVRNGYEAEIDIQAELSQMITLWLEKQYVGNEQEDINNFAHMVTKFFNQT